jgi:hypothetical protein
MKRWAFAIIVIFGLHGHAAADPVLNPENGHYYERIDIAPGVTWDEAKALAEGMVFMGAAGHLATITGEKENKWIVLNLANPSTDLLDHWLGGYQEEGATEPNQGWHWVTGEVWSYTNWFPGFEPNGSGGGMRLEFDAPDEHSDVSGFWGDENPAVLNAGFIVEFEPYPNTIPSTVLPLLLGPLP